MRNLILTAVLLAAPGMALAESQTNVITLTGSVAPACSTVGRTTDVRNLELTTGVGVLNRAALTATANNRTLGPFTCNGTAAVLSVDANPISTSWDLATGEQIDEAIARGFTNEINYIATIDKASGGYSSGWTSGSITNASSPASVTNQTIGLFKGSVVLSFASPSLPSGASTLIAGSYSGNVVITISPTA